MANALFLYPNRADASVSYTPTGSGGAWLSALPLTNLQDPDLSLPARSLSARRADARMRWDLAVSRSIRGVVIPKSNLSSAGRFRVIGVPGDMLFDYEAGDDIAALGGTFSRTPTAGVLAATYVDKDGVIQYAGENRVTYSEQFDNAAWTKSSVTISANSVAAPLGTGTTADTLTASGSNGTCRAAVTTVAVSYTFSVWLKRKTGSGNVDLTMDGTTYVTKAVTTDWQRFEVTQTGVAGTSNPGVRIVTSGDAVYAWGAQVEIGSAAKSYLVTTSAAVSAPRDDHWVDGVRTLLLEGARTNLVPNNADLSTWTDQGTPVVTGGQADAFGGTDEWLIEDNDATNGVGEGKRVDLTFTGDAVKAISVVVRQGTAAQSVIQLRDVTASADRLVASITWASGDPGTPSCSPGTYLGKVALTGGRYRLYFQTASVTAANTNRLYLYGATAASTTTGSTYYAFPQAENAAAPGSLIVTAGSTVARAADSFSFAWAGGTPAAMSGLIDYYDQGAYNVAVSAVVARGLAWIGASGANTTPYIQLGVGTTGRGTIAMDNAVDAAVSSAMSTSPTYGQRAQLLGTVTSAGAVQASQALSGGSFTAASASSAPASGLPTAWAGTTITIGDRPGGSVEAAIALRSLRFVSGVQTGAYMEAVVHDSGWLDAWPSGETAETLAGMNLPLIDLFDAAADIRYVSVQIDDEDNADGYVDLNRLVVGSEFQPTNNFNFGASLGVESTSRRERGRTGKSFYDEQPRYRYWDFTLGTLTSSEAMADVLDFMRVAGIHTQFYAFFDPADTTNWHRTSFLAVLERLSTLTFPDYDRRAVAYRLVEEI